MITLKEFPKYPIQLWIQPSRLEICRPKENVEIPQNRNGIKLNNFFETFFYFFPDSTLPKHVENPKGTAFCSVKDGGIMIMEEVIPKEPKAEELRNIAKIINQLFKNADERFSIFWRSFDLFIEWEQEAHSIRLIQDTLSKSHELRKLAPAILEMLETTESGLTKMRKNKIRTEWDYAQHIKMCHRNIKNIIAILKTMNDLL